MENITPIDGSKMMEEKRNIIDIKVGEIIDSLDGFSFYEIMNILKDVKHYIKGVPISIIKK